MRVRVGLFALALCCVPFDSASAQQYNLWETGALPDDTLFEYPSRQHYEWLRWRVCPRGATPQFSDCLTKVDLLESAWGAFLPGAFSTPSKVSRAAFAATLELLYEETARLDGQFPVGRLAR